MRGILIYIYALEVLKNRFEAGEKAIATDVGHSYHYVRDVLKGKFQLAEEKILNSIYKQEYLDFLKEKGIMIWRFLS